MDSKKDYLKILKNGGVGVISTDTLYGLVGSALNSETVERIYKIKKRKKDKPFIILISEVSDLKKFGVRPDKITKEILKKYWPGKVSIILPLNPKPQTLYPSLRYLHRGKKSLAFRLPDKKSLLKIIKETGPLVAPSANPEGKKPATGIKEAKKYFGNQVDFYKSGGRAARNPSKIVKIEKKGDRGLQVLRG